MYIAYITSLLFFFFLVPHSGEILSGEISKSTSLPTQETLTAKRKEIEEINMKSAQAALDVMKKKS